MATPTVDQQIACVSREIALRERPAITIPLREGLDLIIDERDLWWFGYWHWSLLKSRSGRTWYLYRREADKTAAVWLHREVVGCPAGLLVDHINGNGLDNRRANLRLATRRQNNWNRTHPPSGTYRGVSFHLFSGLWRARLRREDGNEQCSYHHTEIGAALAYDHAAKEQRGEFATLNFPQPVDRADHEIACMKAVLKLVAERANAST